MVDGDWVRCMVENDLRKYVALKILKIIYDVLRVPLEEWGKECDYETLGEFLKNIENGGELEG